MSKNKSTLKYNIMVFKIGALWPPNNVIGYIFYRIYNVILYSTVTFALPFHIVQRMIHGNGGPLEIMDCLFLLIQEICLCIKIIHLTTIHKEMKSIVELLDQEKFTKYSVEQENIMVETRRLVLRNSLGVLIGYFLSSLLMGFAPIFDAEKKKLPTFSWYPFDVTRPVVFPLMYSYELIGLVLSAVTNGCLDTFISGLMIHAAGQIELLKDTFTNIKTRALQKLKENDNKYLNNNFSNSDIQFRQSNKKLQNMIYEEMVQAIEHHLAIISFVRTIESTFNWELFTQFLASSIVLCITGFELTLIQPFTMRFLSITMYQLCILIQYFLYCYYGNDIEHKSSGIGEAIYMGEWYLFDRRINKALWIIMERTKKPMNISSGKIVKLSLVTFMSIVRSAYSFYAVLRQMNANIVLEK